LPRVEIPRERAEWFIRFGVANGRRVPDNGIFQAARAAIDSPETESWAAEAIRESVAWFNEHMPVCRPIGREHCFLRENEHDFESRLWELARILRSQGVQIEMVAVRRPRHVGRDDGAQIAAVPD